MFSDEIIAQAQQNYITYLNNAGLDGQDIFDKMSAIADRVADDYADIWDTEFNYTDWDMSAADGYTAVYD
jgi:hypothetical protein